jgi:hypothetical protein
MDDEDTPTTDSEPISDINDATQPPVGRHKRCSQVDYAEGPECKRVCAEFNVANQSTSGGNSGHVDSMSDLPNEDGLSPQSMCVDSPVEFSHQADKCDMEDGSDTKVFHTKPQQLHINNLPYPILLRVFQNLTLYDRESRAALVCLYWLRLSRDPVLWNTLGVGGQRKITDEVLLRLARYSNNITVVDITDCRTVTDSGFISLLHNCFTSIKSLTLAG